jgi:hypothetical protein
MTDMTFDDLKFRTHSLGYGVQARVDFPNGYGASVVKLPGSYGFETGKYELAVLEGDHLTYNTPIASDVVGNCTPEDITDLLARIEAL